MLELRTATTAHSPVDLIIRPSLAARKNMFRKAYHSFWKQEKVFLKI